MASFFKELIFGPEKKPDKSASVRAGYDLRAGNGRLAAHHSAAAQKVNNPARSEKVVDDRIFRGGYRNAALTKNVIKNFYGDEKIRKHFGLDTRDKVLEAGAHTFGKQDYSKLEALKKIAEYAEKKQWDKIPGMTPEMEKILKNSPTAQMDYIKKWKDTIRTTNN